MEKHGKRPLEWPRGREVEEKDLGQRLNTYEAMHEEKEFMMVH